MLILGAAGAGCIRGACTFAATAAGAGAVLLEEDADADDDEAPVSTAVLAGAGAGVSAAEVAVTGEAFLVAHGQASAGAAHAGVEPQPHDAFNLERYEGFCATDVASDLLSTLDISSVYLANFLSMLSNYKTNSELKHTN